MKNIENEWNLWSKSKLPCRCPSSIFCANMSLCRQFLRGPRLLSQCQRLSVLSQQKCNESTDPDSMSFTFASPGKVYYNAEVVKQVDVPTLSGVFGILARHVPTIAALKPGIVSVFEQDGVAPKKIFVSSGTVTVNNDSSVQILAEEAHPLESFEAKEVQHNLQEAQNAVNSAKTDQDKAEAQIAVECLEELTKAMATTH
ncbi:ATP synthase subunit delta, mitochondrial-like [Mercenaria mercenaria]|uniref:ATP synthase subunit delta, mitochondrial-like n=1 Tax=Mercenaria mercenaria TaxID=6596 RepID=UPI001E1D50ED|nr:ATP synthase subunit delta, mitochondrial-like [Mercenaria mercenaria]XP_053395830.1 ATP synthase subunit delta, mitochondrial-like [Mercenaria mercenaria]